MNLASKEQRILCLQPTSIFERYGGAEYYLDDLLSQAAALLGNGKVRALVPRRGDSFSLFQRPYTVEAVQFKRQGLLGKIENRYSSDYFWTAMANISEFKPTLLLCAHVSLAPMTMALSRLSKIPYTVIALGIETWGNLWPQDEYALRNANRILAISDWTRQILVKRGYNADRISIVHPTINEQFESLPTPTHSKSETLRLLTVSRLDANEQYKGQDHVLEALHHLRAKSPKTKFHYTIQGDGTDKTRLERLTETLGLSKEVSFTPAKRDRNELIETYKNSDLFIMPSRFGRWNNKWHGEGFGIVYVEAAMVGVPSIAYDCGGVKDIIRSGENGILVPQDNKEALADAILLFDEKKTLSAEMGKKAYSIAKSSFGPAQMRTSLKTFLES